ncbi:MAG TPA: glycosyltransferase family 4 protein [Albidovulum sp.]|uniref:glycosyltransferase family 4 protein n=1 Tax=Albidovulum sp. TaxID=1872424 RepID=UPI002BB6E05B|nr:glycosyltransferase family 4 protein [Albidovulum sp.]
MLGVPVEASGLSQTCWSILQGLSQSGWPVRLHAPSQRSGAGGATPITTVLPNIAARLPFDLLRPMLQQFAHRQFLSALRQGEVAYLWPTVPLRTFEAVARRGIPIVTEAVNTRMAAAKDVLDAAYDALGAAPDHGITPERIAMQEARNALCAAIFVPSPAVEISYLDTHYAARALPASFGTWVPETLPDRPGIADRPVRFLFVGRDGVRKGLHLLLDAWREAPGNAELRIVGEIPSLLQDRFADVLNLPSVSAAGFSSEMESEYLAADVAILPSLEEGDPIVTYEAASYGLPVIASTHGAGRFGAETGLVEIVEPREIAALKDTIHRFARDEEMRRDLGLRSRAASSDYDWSRVAPARFQKLSDFLAR